LPAALRKKCTRLKDLREFLGICDIFWDLRDFFDIYEIIGFFLRFTRIFWDFLKSAGDFFE